MHISTFLLLPLLVAADQVPLKEKAAGWFDKAKSYIPSGTPPDPIDAGAAVVADRVVEKINIRNWQRKLAPKPDTEEEWMIYMTGGNKTCFGRCGNVDQKWNESVPLLAALPQPAGSPPLHLGYIDCEKEEVLCTGWAVNLPSVYHFNLPKKSEPQAKTPLHVVPLNMTSATVEDIVSIPAASKARYLEYPEYTGLLHPLDGLLAKLGLLHPFGYLMWGLGATPSWVMMIFISFVSRQLMSRRMTGGRWEAPTAGAAAQGQATPAAQQGQTPSRPAPAAAPKSGGGRKRK
ncbi:hypothetical protein HRR83_009050 [Exophiala dermatitidis]|uniref:PTH2 family peptidyl-tRNA hydrolase n=2 Tax=Exophiala dermatitidis TaxID=5970 RepID=H6BWQ8_EXODN|nr:PTH2 family peptidyl-tRNA hydrolase [Exophiala dermatitidis NIH/UT8656]KAJ4503198.1 hypothetical protein HRR73_009209 [Exophiala dermatitidis]EHY55249.1 PTH2 family peptidyl-tRNA hydrolase [Exophiala dermatitidis NIH/UT8656]KAJ4506136.1 hypothetical protein HRR75_006991 [Exophiala dermatitidis]KAJ4508223.1 hypothetical protein HRR74_007622 [Exophiala dermatitidis]KAJ4533225.1 hypothetical protein HRR77_008757 [Exophiala dermatitidis]